MFANCSMISDHLRQLLPRLLHLQKFVNCVIAVNPSSSTRFPARCRFFEVKTSISPSPSTPTKGQDFGHHVYAPHDQPYGALHTALSSTAACRDLISEQGPDLNSGTSLIDSDSNTIPLRLHSGPASTFWLLTTALFETGSLASIVSDSVVKSMIVGGAPSAACTCLWTFAVGEALLMSPPQ